MVQEIKSTCVPVEFFTMGLLGNNVYVIDDGVGCLVVDPSCDADFILEVLAGHSVSAILLTHGHGDHIGAAAALREATGAKVVASALEEPYINGTKSYGAHSLKSTPCPVDWVVAEGDVVRIGNMEWQVMATPGHTAGGICFYLDSYATREGAPVLLSGDILFAGTHGRVDFSEGDIDDMRESLVRLSYLPAETVVLPGHGAITTIKRESGWLRICR